MTTDLVRFDLDFGPSSGAHERVEEIVRSLDPLIRSFEDQIELDRTIPPALVDALYDAGVFLAYTPRELGGLGLHPVEWLTLVEGLARINGSVGWLAMIQAGRVHLDDELMREIIGNDRWITAGSAGRVGKAYRVDGGFRISGMWVFASGSPHATYLSCSSMVYDDTDNVVLRTDNGLPLLVSMIIPASDATLHDTWDGLGLRGTGSGAFELRDYFVPDRFTNHGQQFQNPPLFERSRDPMLMLHTMGHAAHALGIARAAVDAFIELSGGTASSTVSKRERLLGRQQLHEVAVGRADALIRSARLFAWDTQARAADLAVRNGALTMEMVMLMRECMTHVVRTSKEAVELVFEQAGTHAVIRGRTLERCLRDVVTAAQHSLVLPATYATVGRYYLTKDLEGGPAFAPGELFYHIIPGTQPES